VDCPWDFASEFIAGHSGQLAPSLILFSLHLRHFAPSIFLSRGVGCLAGERCAVPQAASKTAIDIFRINLIRKKFQIISTESPTCDPGNISLCMYPFEPYSPSKLKANPSVETGELEKAICVESTEIYYKRLYHEPLVSLMNGCVYFGSGSNTQSFRDAGSHKKRTSQFWWLRVLSSRIRFILLCAMLGEIEGNCI
jgi:hypothetical protein